MKESLCRAGFRIAIDGWVGPGVDRAKSECGRQYSRWTAELPPTPFTITDDGINVGHTILSRNGLRVRKGHVVIAGIGDITFPAVILHHEGGDVTLRFQTESQANAAFKSITESFRDNK